MNTIYAPTGSEIALVALAAFLPMLLSFASALRPDGKPETARHFFLYDGGLDTGSFATGSVGYSMQVASIYLFLLWFQTYGVWAFTVPLAWFAGYGVIALLIRLKTLDEFLMFQSNSVVTIHGYVGESFSGRKWLAFLLAVTSLFGLGGTMLGEIDYALSYYVFPAMTIEPPKGGYAVSVFILVLMTAGSYIMWSGYKAAIDTDVFQVKVAYIVLGVVIGILCLGASKAGNWPVSVSVCAFMAVFCGFAIRHRSRLSRIDPQYTTSGFDKFLFWAMAAIVVACAAAGFVLRGAPLPSTPVGLAVFAGSSSLSWGFGLWGFAALVVTNTLWQLIDISALQRLQSLRFDPSGPGEHAKLTSAIFTAGVEGAGSWCMVLVIAVLIKASGVADASVFTALGGIRLLVPAFIYIVVAFMLSTLDTLIAASGYVFHYDITRVAFPAEASSDEQELRRARLGTMGCLLVVAGLYYAIRIHYSEDPIKLGTIVYAIYAVQASILGPVAVALFAPVRRRNLWFSLAGLLAGWAAAYCTTIGTDAPLFGMPLDSWYVFPPFAALSASVIVSAFGCLFPGVAGEPSKPAPSA